MASKLDGDFAFVIVDEKTVRVRVRVSVRAYG